MQAADFWRGISLKEQSILQYRLPGKLNDRMSVTQFLKGRIMEGTNGCPEIISERLFGKLNGQFVVAPLQKHKTAFIDASPIWALPSRPEADAVFIRENGVYGSLRFADCIPIVMVSESPFDWCLLVHSGFIGTCDRIITKVIRRIQKFTEKEGIETSFAWVGPGIGPCCYSRRADDPLTHYGVRSLPSECIRREGNLFYFDLTKAIVTFLYDMNVQSSRIATSAICTACSPELCHSYRRGDSNERSFLLARIFPGCHNSLHWWENMSDGV